jgi:membrane-bound ClpP family serine protease
MEFLINLNIAYLLIVTAVMLAMLNFLLPGSLLAKAGMLLCLVAAGFELYHLQANPWALLVAALSLLPFMAALQQTRLHRTLLVLTILMLVVGAFFLFSDQEGHPAVNSLLAGLVSIACAQFIWLAGRREPDAARRGQDPNSMVGLIGQARTDVFETGLVKIEGEFWPARSHNPIPAGSMVRILRSDGTVLFVKKVEKMTRD